MVLISAPLSAQSPTSSALLSVLLLLLLLLLLLEVALCQALARASASAATSCDTPAWRSSCMTCCGRRCLHIEAGTVMSGTCCSPVLIQVTSSMVLCS
jgi:hypothetical protein